MPGLGPRALPTTLEAPPRPPAAPQPPPSPPALSPAGTGRKSYLATGVRSGLYRGSAAPSRGCRPPVAARGPHAGRRRPRGPEVCELRSPTAQSQRRPQKSLSSPPPAPPVPRAESNGAAAFRPSSDSGGGGESLGRRRGRGRWARSGGRGGGKFQDRGHQQRRSGLRGSGSQRRAEGPPRAPLGTGAHAAPHQPPAQPVTRSVTRSRPRPAAAPAEPQYLQDQPWTAPRAAPRLPAAALPRRSLSPLRRVLPSELRAHGPPPPSRRRSRLLRRRRSNSFSLLQDFRGRGGESGEKLGVEALEILGCDRGAGSDRRRPWSCGRCGPGRPALRPAASAALLRLPLLRRELAGAAHSSTGRCAAHPARAVAARPLAGHAPSPSARARRHAPFPARARGRRARPAPRSQGSSWTPGLPGGAPPGNLT